jgi:hypothetical protein
MAWRGTVGYKHGEARQSLPKHNKSVFIQEAIIAAPPKGCQAQ